MEDDGDGYPVVAEPTPATLIEKPSGHPILVDPFGYIYKFNSSNKNSQVVYYVCVKKPQSRQDKNGCKATARIKDGAILGTTRHTHGPDAVALKTLKVRHEIKAAVLANPFVPTALVVADWATKVSEPSLATSAPLPSSMTREVNKLKSKLRFRPVPADAPDATSDKGDIPDRYKMTLEGTPFLRSEQSCSFVKTN
jgi:hypothetical protein